MGKRISILILEPDEQSAQKYAEAFSHRGWLVHQAHTFTEALELMPSHLYDIAVIEVMLPDMVGMDAWNYLHKLSPDTAGIITTSSHSLRISVNASEPGIISYLLKPFDLELVADLIVQAMEQKQLLIQNRRIAAQLSALNTLLVNAARSAPDIAVRAALAQLPSVLKPEWVGLYSLHPDRTWMPYWELNNTSKNLDWMDGKLEFLEQLMTRSVDSLQPVVIGVRGELESVGWSAKRSDGASTCLVVVPLVGHGHTHGALILVNGIESGQDVTAAEIELIKIIGQSIAVALDRAQEARSPLTFVGSREDVSAPVQSAL